MMAPRRAVPDGATLRSFAVLRTLAVVLASALTGVLAMISLVSIRMARRVVTPAGRRPDTRIVDVDVAAQTITVSRTPDTVLPGRYGLFTTGTADYLKVGSVLAETGATVTRKLLTQVAPESRLGADAAFSGWYYPRPEELHLPYHDVQIPAALGTCPAWEFPADGGGDTWVIQIHGRGTTRAECLRAVPLFHARGITSLLVSYRNDGDGPHSRTGTYALGATEWRDIDAAIGYARRHGAARVVLMGWSMGGAIALQAALGSAHREFIAGVVLDSPVIDWRVVLNHQARLVRLPTPVAGLTIGALRTEWATKVTGAGSAIPFDRLDVVARAGELRHPVLILHSDDDGFVPSDASHRLADARPDLVELQVFDTARHTKLWNYDQDRWTSTIEEWLDRLDLSAPSARSRVEG